MTARLLCGTVVAIAALLAPAAGAQSGDRERLVFSGARESQETRDLYSVTPTGADMRVITSTPKIDEGGTSASADGRLISFGAIGPGQEDEIYTIRPDGTDLVRVTHTPDEWVGEPALSPDGSRIAYARTPPFDAEYQAGWDLYMADADGSNERRLTIGERGELPTWSPDGKQLAYIGWQDTIDQRTGAWSLYVLDLASGSRRRIGDADVGHNTDHTGGGAYPGWPAWCPSGDRIVFSRYVWAFGGPVGTYDADLYSVAPDGSNLEALTTGPDRDADPACSLDGRRIAFGRTPAVEAGQGGLMVLDLTSRALTQVTLPAWGRADWEPTWVLASAAEAAPLAPAPAAPPPVAAPARRAGKVLVAPRRLRLSRRGRLRVLLRCLGPDTCQGRLAVSARGRIIGTARYAIAPGALSRVTVTVRPAVRRRLQRRRRTIVTVAGERAGFVARKLVLVAGRRH